ncbi:MAG: phosphoenolpyruvate carboxylase [Nitrososphaerota archaeon]|jgi:phosphoenolpyruvate carboxylase|nr:phosphoenolpyruvate carboxylase [Nitrososphaerota archaeon]
MKNEVSIPKTMSTQHPDNVNVPEWCKAHVIDGNAEVFEAYYAYETLGCQEVMWDSEGKDVDTRVLRKLMDKHWKFFENHIVGKDEFLTYRIPNPRIEAIEKKVVTETLQNIPMAYDAASSFYKKDITPIFEVILPFTTDGKEPVWLYNYYKNAIVHAEDALIDEEGIKAKDWVGQTNPKTINVIPLVEDFKSIYNVDAIVQPYIKTVKPKHMRVFIARSDPALNYGLICAVLLSKIGLYKLKKLEKQENVPIHPILGVGSKPFRGHLSPDNVDNFLQEYKGLSTVTVQSAARYDYPLEQVQECVKTLNSKLPNGEPDPISTEEEKLLTNVLDKCKKQYEYVAEVLAPLVNCLSPYVPQRRARKLHIGLFGYSRSVAGVSLPRAIPFASALYSIGVPPEFIGAKALEDLTEPEYNVLSKTYINLKHDYCTVGGYVSWENVNMLMEMHSRVAKRAGMNVDTLRLALTRILADLKTVEEKLDTKLGPRTFEHRKHENFTNNFLINYLEGEETEACKALVEAAKIRRCLG